MNALAYLVESNSSSTPLPTSSLPLRNSSQLTPSKPSSTCNGSAPTASSTASSISENCYMCQNDSDAYARALSNRQRGNTITCTVCNETQHETCYNVTSNSVDHQQSFACLRCRILQNQPELQEFETILGPILIENSGKSNRCSFSLTRQQSLSLRNNSFYELAVYCTKIDMHNNGSTGLKKPNYYAWPSNNIVVKLNNQLQSYALDTLVYLEKQQPTINFHGDNSFFYDLGDSSKFDPKIVIGIALVKVGNSHDVLHSIALAQSSRTTQNIKQMYADWSKDIEVSISLKDQITRTPIKWPCRGRNCEHQSCIDLFTYLEFNQSNNNLEKGRWVCPMCQKKIYVKDVIFDTYLYNFLREDLPRIEADEEVLGMIDEVSVDQQGNIRISDDCQRTIKRFKLKKFLRSEKKRINEVVQKKRRQLEAELASFKMNGRRRPSSCSDLPSNVEYKALDLDDYVAEMTSSDLYQRNLRQLSSLTPLQLVARLFQDGDCKHLRLIRMKSQRGETLSSIDESLSPAMKYNSLIFNLVHGYAYDKSLGEDDKAAACLAFTLSAILALARDDSVNSICERGEFIEVILQYSLFATEKQKKNRGEIYGNLLYYYGVLFLDLDKQLTVALVRQFFNYPGGNVGNSRCGSGGSAIAKKDIHLELALMDDSGEISAETLAQVVKLLRTKARKNDEDVAGFVSALFLKDFTVAAEQERSDEQKKILEIIVHALIKADERARDHQFDKVKIFLARFVDGCEATLEKIKQLALPIFANC